MAGKIFTASAIALGSASFISLFLTTAAEAQSELPPVTVEAPKPRPSRPVVQRAPVRVQAARPAPVPAAPVDVQPLTLSKDTEATENSNSYTSTRAGVGTKSGAAIKDTPQSISVMTRTRMDQQNITSVEDAMRNTTGMTVLEADAGRSDIYSRGYRVDAIQIDGVSSNLNNFFSFPDLYFYDRVETLRGPNALFTGSGNPSASINLVRKRALDVGQFQGSVSYGSFNAKRGEFDITGPLNEQKTVRARIAAAYDDKELFYRLPSGNPSFYKRPSVYGTVEADITEDTTLSFGTMYNSTDYTAFFGWPTYASGTQLPVSRNTMFGADWNRWTSSTLDKFVELEHRFDNGARAKVTFRDSDRESDGIYATPSSVINPVTGNGTLNRVHIGPTQNNKTLDAFVSTPFELFGQTQNITVGSDWRKSDYLLQTGNAPAVTQNIFNPVVLPYQDMPFGFRSNTVETQSGVYGQMRFKPLHWLTLIGGGRLSQWETSTVNRGTGAVSGVADISNKLTANYGAVVDVTKEVSLYASYADIFQPQTTQMAAGGVVPPRMGQQEEAGIKTSLLGGRVNAHFAVFKINDVNRSVTDPSNPAFALPSGEVESKGFETEVSGRILPGWDLTAGYAYTRTKFLTDSVTNEGQTFQTQTPAHSYNLWSRYLFEEGPLKGLSIAGGARIVSSFYTRTGNLYITQGGYQVLTAQLGYQFTPNVWATLTATNALDQNYYQYVNSTTIGNRFGEPRSIILKVSSRW